jgi:dynactin complex subunit
MMKKMTDEELSISDATLIALLRDAAPVTQDFQHTLQGVLLEASADRIEEFVATNEDLQKALKDQSSVSDRLAANNERLEEKLAKAEAGLLAIAKRDEQMIWGEDYEVEEAFKDMRDIALATLAAVSETHKIKGESHE